MSARNTHENKRQRRNLRKLRKGRLPAYINLIEWIKLRSNVTTFEAQNLLLAGVLRVDSHKLGFVTRDNKKFLSPYVNADVRGRITVHDPTEDRDDR